MAISKEELYDKWSRLGYKGSAEELNGIPLDDLTWCYRKIKQGPVTDTVRKNNLALLLHAAKEYIEAQEDMYYVALGSGYPYQESSAFGAKPVDTENFVLRVFSNPDTAIEWADEINHKVHDVLHHANKDIVIATKLGEYQHISPNDAIRQFGVKYLIYGAPVDGRDVRVSVEKLNLPKPNGTDYYAIAPETRALFGALEQSISETRPKTEIENFKSLLTMEIPHHLLGYAVDAASLDANQLIPVIYQEGDTSYLDAFTDWTLLREVHKSKDVLAAVGDWEMVARENMPVYINRWFSIDADLVPKLVIFTERGRMAYEYIAYRYKINTEIESGSSRAIEILMDIFNVPELWYEFKCGLFTVTGETDTEGNPLPDRVDFKYPEGKLFTVHDYNAKQCEQSGLCANPAAAYHVLAKLANDADGSAWEAFTDARLYE